MSATMTQSQAQAAAKFVMPKPDIGQAVHWYPAGDKSGGTGRPAVAIPVVIGDQAIDVMLIQEDMRTLVRMDGVRHADDPAAVRSEYEDFGSWDFMPVTKITHATILELSQRVQMLESKVLGKRPTKPEGDGESGK